MWGIESVNVISSDGLSSENITMTIATPENLKQAEIRINNRFKHITSEHPVISKIKSMAIQLKAEVIARDQKQKKL